MTSQKNRRMHLIANTKSGKGAGLEIFKLASKVCQELSVELVEYPIHDPSEIDACAKAAVEAAKGTDDVVVAAGGDGTIRSIAEVASQGDVEFAVVPCGTFNFFARAHKIPDDHEAALKLALTGVPTPIRLGEMNGRTFLINASFGSYAKSIEEREKHTKRFGRAQIVALGSTIYTLLRPHRLLTVSINADGKVRDYRTPMIFIGNNALQLRNLNLKIADCFSADRLAVVLLKPVRTRDMVRVLVQGVLRLLDNEERVEQFAAESILIHSKHKSQNVALDGERFKMTSPFKIESRPEALRLIKQGK